MKNKKKCIFFHLSGSLFALIFAWLFFALPEYFPLILSFFFLLFFIIVITMLHYYYKFQTTLKMVHQYDADSANQKRMLHLQDAMLELSSYMTKVNSLTELLDIILRKAIDVIPEAEYGSILVMNKVGQLEFKAIFGFDKELSQITLDPTECYQWRATSGHFVGPLIIHDLSELSKNFMTDDTYIKMNDANALIVKSSLSAPLLIDGQFFGSINIDSVKTNVFKEEHKRLMAYFADQATIAIINHQYYERILFMSNHDNLTGAMNRRHFQEHAEVMIHENSHKNTPITFVIMDLNNFKAINDQYGHASGDIILTFFANSFTTYLLQTDLFTRYGGDEFIAVFFNSDTANTTQKLRTIHKCITQTPITLTTESREVFCSFSYGMAEFPAESTELKTLIHLADQRMYQHKNSFKLKDK